MNLSLPPTENGKTENMMLLVIIPSAIKDPNVNKYYDFIAKYELDDLNENGKKICTTHHAPHTRSDFCQPSTRM